MAPKARLVFSAVIVSAFASLVSRSVPLVVAPLHAPRVAMFAASLKVSVIVSPFSGLPATPPALLVIATADARKWSRTKTALVPIRLGLPPVAVIVWFVLYGPVIVTLSVRTPATKAAELAGAIVPPFVVRVTVPVKPATVE